MNLHSFFLFCVLFCALYGLYMFYRGPIDTHHLRTLVKQTISDEFNHWKEQEETRHQQIIKLIQRQS